MAKTKKADAAAAPAGEGDAAAAKAESPKKEAAPKAGKVAKRGRKKKASPKKAKGKKAPAKKWSASSVSELRRRGAGLCGSLSVLTLCFIMREIGTEWTVFVGERGVLLICVLCSSSVARHCA